MTDDRDDRRRWCRTTTRWRATTRPSASRCTSSSTPRRRCSAAARRSSAPSPTPRSARPASGCPARCRCVNAKAVESAIRIGLALNCEIAEWCRFARKNYFYPDMPKNFQTSPVRRADRVRGLHGRRRRRRDVPRRDRARPHGGGHRQVAPRRRRDRPDPRRRLLAGRLQPRRHPAHRDRHQADHRRAARRRPRSPAPTSPSCATCSLGARRLRRPDGPGLAALRRQPLAGAEGLRARRSAPAPRPRTSTRSARSSARCATRCSGTRPSSPRAARSCRRPGTGTRTPGSPPPAGRSRDADDYRYFPEPDLVPIAPAARVGRGAARRRCRRPPHRAAGPAAGRVGLHRPRDARHRRRRRARAGRGDDRRRGLAAGRPQVVARRAGPPGQRRRGRARRRSASRPADVARVQALVDDGRDQRQAGPPGLRRAARRRGDARRDRRGPRAGDRLRRGCALGRRRRTRSRPTPTSPTRSATARSPPPAPSSAR